VSADLVHLDHVDDQGELIRPVADRMVLDGPATATTSTPARGVVIAAAMLTIVVGFGLGFALSGMRSSDRGTLTAAATSSTTAVPTTIAPRTTVAPTLPPTTAAPTTQAVTTTSIAATTTAAPTTAPIVTLPVPTTPRPTPPPTQAPPTTYAPPKVLVTYAADPQGRFVVPRVGTATLTVTNQGGLASQWLVTGSGFAISGGPSQGTLQPGQSAFISISVPPGEIPATELTGVISILGALNPSIAFVIPAA